jgi:Replication-relaxation
MPKHARKKFVREGATSGRLQIVASDAALLQSVADFRFMNTEQIAALHHRGLRNLQRRLSDLFHEGYLERPRWQKNSHLTTEAMVYSLGSEGVDFLYGDGEERREKLRQVQYDFESAYRHISHELMISQFRATLMLALETSPVKSSLSRWEQGRHLKLLLAPRSTWLI